MLLKRDDKLRLSNLDSPTPVVEEEEPNVADKTAKSKVLVTVNMSNEGEKVTPIPSHSPYDVDNNGDNKDFPARSCCAPPPPPVLKSPHRLFISMADKVDRLDNFLDPYFGMEVGDSQSMLRVALRFLLGVVVFGIHWSLWVITQPTLEAKRSARPGDFGMALHHNSSSLVFLGVYAPFFGNPVFVRAACRYVYAPPSTDSGDQMRVDPHAFQIIMKSMGIYFFLAVLSGGLEAPDSRESFRRMGMLIANLVQLLWYLPRAIKKWVPDGSARGLIGFPIRVGITISLLGYVPVMFMPIALKHLSADQIVLVFPLLLSLVEFGVVVGVFNNRICKGHCEATFASMGRLLVGVFKSYRVGMLVLIVNTKGTYRGLVYGTLLNAMHESFSRNNLFTAGWRFIKQGFVLLYRIPFPSKDPLPLINQPLPAFKRVYLGCKYETGYWAELILFLMKVSKFGYPVEVAVDEATNELLPTLDASWLVLVTLVCGEMVSDAMTVSISKLIAWKASGLSVEVTLVEPGRSVVFQTITWVYCGTLCANSIGSMGSLSDQLLENGEEVGVVEEAAITASSSDLGGGAS